MLPAAVLPSTKDFCKEAYKLHLNLQSKHLEAASQTIFV